MILRHDTFTANTKANRVEAAGLRLLPLPHHPAFGSAPGGSSQITEPEFRDSAGGSGGEARASGGLVVEVACIKRLPLPEAAKPA